MSSPYVLGNTALGFNRYMVECESYRSCSDFGKRRSFNRYMVECEYSSADVILFL